MSEEDRSRTGKLSVADQRSFSRTGHHSLNLALSFRHDFKVKLLAEIRVARQGGVVGQQKAC